MTNDNPVAVVTGASRGIGRALAIRLATDGFDVAGTWNRDEKAADETKTRVEVLGRRCLMYRSDVSDPSATASLVEQMASDFGQVDAVVHNAGIASRGRFVSDTEPAEIQRVLAVTRSAPSTCVPGWHRSSARAPAAASC
jgi:3-oxoacyl-[acyl-carrier protein] reductase